MPDVAPANQESTEAWSGPLFERFVRFRPYVAEGLGRHGEAAMAAHPPRAGERVLDIGCGFGDTTRRLAEMVGAEGEAVGIDVAEPFIELARQEAAEAGVANVSYRARRRADRRPRRPLRLRLLADGRDVLRQPGAGAAQRARGDAAGRARLLRRLAAQAGQRLGVSRPSGWWSGTSSTRRRPRSRPAGRGRSRWPTPTWSREQMAIAGFEAIELRRSDLPMKMGADLDGAVDLVMSIGPAGEVLRLWGDRAEEIRPDDRRRDPRRAGAVRDRRRRPRPVLDLADQRRRPGLGCAGEADGELGPGAHAELAVGERRWCSTVRGRGREPRRPRGWCGRRRPARRRRARGR